MAKIIGGLVVLIVVGALGAWLYLQPTPTKDGNDTNNNTTQLQSFTSANVNVTSPKIGETVSKTFTVTGEVRGNWTFEANLPMKVVDPSGNQVGSGHGTATEDWMTTEFVPFEGTIEIANYTGPAKLVLMKDNPSGLPENDDSVEFDIVIQ